VAAVSGRHLVARASAQQAMAVRLIEKPPRSRGLISAAMGEGKGGF
jgi:hypothetical protein